MNDRADKEAAIIFTQAMEAYANGMHSRAVELFNKVVALCQDSTITIATTTYVAAHMQLYRIHRSLGHQHKAAEHFRTAISLGANANRLNTY